MLHLITEPVLLQAVVERIAAEDDVVLLAGSVWAALSGHQDNAKLVQILARRGNIYALHDPLSMNGITDSQILPGVERIDYAKWVELTVKNPVIHTWC